MRCPVCDTELTQTMRYDVQIDVCPRCRGVWLDRGELDKILALARGFREDEVERTPEQDQRRPYRLEHDVEDRYDDDYSRDQMPSRRRRKKEGIFDLFEDLFD
ncbi:MAG: zf-TFIIB domain-containing protein [Firmicutes bacterium]|nr:zf-TFIIB domain-containing protein [Bacillota bacterium]